MVRIITDSAADFEPFELEKWNITCIPLSVALDGRQYMENVDLSKDQFFALLTSTQDTPKSSQPSPELLMNLFAEAKAAGDEALFISLSSALSGTYQTAVMTCEDAESEDCYVFDSLNATGGQRLLVEYAVRLRDEGKCAKEILDVFVASLTKVPFTAKTWICNTSALTVSTSFWNIHAAFGFTLCTARGSVDKVTGILSVFTFPILYTTSTQTVLSVRSTSCQTKLYWQVSGEISINPFSGDGFLVYDLMSVNIL